MKKILAILLILGAFLRMGCSVTVGTVNLSQGESKPSTEIMQSKPVSVKTDAQASAIPQ